MSSNLNAIKFNLELGYSLSAGQEGLEHQQYEISRESFEKKSGKIRKALRAITGNESLVEVLFDDGDYAVGLAQKVEEAIRIFAPHLERQESPEGIWYRDRGRNSVKS
jgi:hypothetical protein